MNTIKDIIIVLMPLILVVVPIAFNQNGIKKSIDEIILQLSKSKKYRKEVLRWQLFNNMKTHLENGFIKEREFFELSNIYEFGHNELEINSEITALYEKVKKLERIDD